jgi:DNA repair exonuclease SbcCD ATPase subunit
MSSHRLQRSLPQTHQPSANGRNPGKKRITKDQKICQLKSQLKVSKAENARLRKEIERLKQGAGSSKEGTPAKGVPKDQAKTVEEQQKKFREAMRAVKKVTVSQEMCIKTLRTKATQRRQEIKERDNRIKSLEKKLASLEDTTNRENEGNGVQQTERMKDLQRAYDDLLQKKDELEELLDEKETHLEALQKQRNKLLTPSSHKGTNRETSDGESVGSGSLQSVSTAGDFDVARLKTELAKKSEKILALQMDLEMVKDELYEMKQQKGTFSGDPFGSTGSNPFSRQKSFPTGEQSGDDWTEADETDNESEFGEMQFGECFFKKDEENVDFW